MEWLLTLITTDLRPPLSGLNSFDLNIKAEFEFKVGTIFSYHSVGQEQVQSEVIQK